MHRLISGRWWDLRECHNSGRKAFANCDDDGSGSLRDVLRAANADIQSSTVNKEKVIDGAVLLLRVAAGLIFLQAGGMKMLDWFGGIPAAMGGHPKLLSQVWMGGFLELVGGTLIMVGLLTRPVAFILSGEMAVAYFQFHQPNGVWPIQNHGEAAALFCFIFLFFAAYGAGPWSLDGILARRRKA